MTPEVRTWLHDAAPRPAQRDPRRPGHRHAARGRARARPPAGRPHPPLPAEQPQGATARLSRRSEIRILYIFDPRRNAVLLVAGDKAGQWDAWYRSAIPLAEERYADYLKHEGSSR